MFPKVVSNHSIRFRFILFNKISFKRNFLSVDKQLFESRINCHKNNVFIVRPFCQKINNDLNKGFNETNLKSLEKQNENQLQIKAKELPKRSEFFYLILKKPNELMEWIEKTPKEKKKNILFSAIIKYLIKPMGAISLLVLVYIFANSDENQIGRKCIYAIPKELSDEIENDIFKEIFLKNMDSGTFMQSTDPLVKRLDIVFEKLIENNKDLDVIGEGIWTPVVINDYNICDVIILKKSQNVFVYRKMLDLCQTDDELAYVLAHQLSHVMLDHKREAIANASIVFAPILALLPRFWAINKDPSMRLPFFERVDTFLEDQIKAFIRKTLSYNPYNAELEEEADRIAMQLMTRSCYDIRKCRQFCKKYKSLSESVSKSKDQNIDERNQFFKTHPITEQKLLYLFQYIKPFIELRKECVDHCPQL